MYSHFSLRLNFIIYTDILNEMEDLPKLHGNMTGVNNLDINILKE